MEYKDIGYQEGALYLLLRLRRFTVLRGLMQEPPLLALNGMLEALHEGNPFLATEQYHTLSHALLSGGYLRISGSLLQDYLLYGLLERENAFSALAAQGNWDEPLSAAMRADLKLLNAAFSLTSAALKKWIGECFRDVKSKPRQQKDAIAMMSSAVWSGGSSRPLPRTVSEKEPAAAAAMGRLPASLDENDFISWRYQPEQQEEDAFPDSPLEELCRRLIHTEDRELLLDDLWNFHANCGTDIFVRGRLFQVDASGGLSPIALHSEPDAYSLYLEQRELEIKNAIRFMQGEHADNMLLTGGPGTGKTMQVFALARELPELRLVCCPRGRLSSLIALLPKLLRQPFKLAILLDDFSPEDPLWPTLRADITPGGAQSENLLLIACAREADDALFPLKIHLPTPQLKEFIELVQLILLQQGKDVDFDSIQNACIDYAASVGANGGSPLSFRSAGVIARTMLEDE